MLSSQQKATSQRLIWQDRWDSSGVRDLGTLHTVMSRELGRPCDSSKREYGLQAIQSEEAKRFVGSRIGA